MEKNWNRIKIDFNTKTNYGDDDDDDKYIKTKIKTYRQYNCKFL